MAKISESFSGKWLNATDVPRQGLRTTIVEITEEDIGQGQDKKTKLVLWLKGQEKGLVLNKTNGGILAELYGDETDLWNGKRVVIKTQKVEYQGRRVDGIRVDEDAIRRSRSPRPPAAAARKPAPALTQEEANGNDDPPW